MKTFSKILMVILILIFLVVAVLGFLEMPVATEGEELTAAQRVLVALKTHLSTILTAIGLPLDAVLLALFVAINKQAAAATRRADASRRPAGIDASISHKDSHLSVSRVPVHNAAIGASIRIASAVLFGVRF